jgi:membrane-associated phospholipid phosphatase
MKLKKILKSLSLRVLLVATLFFLSFFVFVVILDEVVLENETAFDIKTYACLHQLTSPFLTHFFSGITFLGSHTFLLPAYVLLVCYYLFVKKNKKLSIDIIALGLSSLGILFLLKNIFERSRPADPLLKPVSGFSFPSGHTFSSFVFFGLLIYIIWRTKLSLPVKWVCSILFFFIAFLIGVSRVYLHVHFPSDVLAGFFLSIIWLTLSFWILRRLNPEDNR